MTQVQLSAHLLLELAIILGVCRLVGMVGKRLGQPQAVCEMVAGLLLGPSLLGIVGPALQEWLFPPQSRPILHALAQVGLVLYMFITGATFRVDMAVARARIAAAVSVAGIVAPFVLGGALAWPLFQNDGLFVAGVSFPAAAMFLGAALSITAFPILARILEEQGLSRTRLGALALAAASLDDVIAWCALAVVVAMTAAAGSCATAWLMVLWTVGGGAMLCMAIWWVARPLAKWIERRAMGGAGTGSGERVWPIHPSGFGIVLVLLMLRAWASDVIGLHAVFGSFILGLAMPRGRFVEALERMVTPAAVTLLLPLFFVYTGLHTKLALIDSWPLALIAALVFIVACVSKFAACAVAARVCGVSTRESLGIGALMNARGMTGLIVLNMGLERGILTPTLFTIGVVTAVLTTVLATPLFRMSQRFFVASQADS